MCGIAGFWTSASLSDDAQAALTRMTDAIRHRGPDAQGHWLDPDCGVALGHRRLSILDLSDEGSQPMQSSSGRYVIVFNGEIYNFADIRHELRSVRFRGHSDTEVMLAAIERWGLFEATRRFVGMFAFALWDRERRWLSLVRDRIGEKPLYWGWSGSTLLFGSELKAMRAHPDWTADVDRAALTLYLRHNYIPAPYSIYEGVHKVRPATILTFAIDRPGAEPVEQTYWSARDAAERGVANARSRRNMAHAELVDELDTVLSRAIGEQMIADVPVGAFLSGGIDSSLIVALMQAQADRRVRTFSIGFHEPTYNEADHAKAVAHHLGTEHTELYVTPAETLDVVPRLPSLWDEPFSDSSQIPTHLVAALARQHVAVALSGDAGDELFGGYNRYFLGERIWRTLSPVPLPLRRGLAATMRGVPPGTWDRAFSAAQPLLPRSLRFSAPGDRIHKLANIVELASIDDVYRSLQSHWTEPSTVVRDGYEKPTALTSPDVPTLDGPISRMMYLDLISYLPDDILVKVDRAAMGVSLESRAPFLDHRVVEFAWSLPLQAKVGGGVGKRVLRSLLDRHVPRALIDRPKMGFGVPIDRWLRGPLRDWAESLLDERRIREAGFLDPRPIREKWTEHQSGARNWQYLLWDVLMFEAWRDAQVADSATFATA